MAQAFYQNVNGTLTPISWMPFKSHTQAELDALPVYPEGTIVHVEDGVDDKKVTTLKSVTTDANGNFDTTLNIADGVIFSMYCTRNSIKLIPYNYNGRYYATALQWDMSRLTNGSVDDVIIITQKV